MEKNLSALGFMSGTSGDGVDTSVINSNGKDIVNIKYNRFDPYPISLSKKIHRLKESILGMQDLLKYSNDILNIEREITDFHADIAVYDFRKNDIKNGGEGAPLSPIYHLALVKSLFNDQKIKIPISILNIGGIANITMIDENFNILSKDIGPGNCLIDKWVRKHTNKLYDYDGNFGRVGKVDKFIFDQYLENYFFSKINTKRSLDTNDFDISFAKGLSLENGSATITDITAELITKKI